MMLSESKWAPAGFQAACVAFDDGARSLACGADTGGKNRAGGEADEVVRVGKPPGLVKVVDPPDQAAFGGAPGAEVLDVQVADGEHGGSFRGRPAGVSPCLGTRIVSGSQEWER